MAQNLVGKPPRDVLIVSILVGASLASFGLGFLAGRDLGEGRGPGALARTTPSGTPGEVVASRGGTRYYLPTCTGVERISAEKKVWYASAAHAEQEGYEPAKDCEGL